jgi:hypothetical protein
MMSFAWLHRILDRYGPSRRLRVVEDDALPSKMPWRDLVLTNDDGAAWSVGMRCPCRCGDTIELLLIPGANPRWDMQIDELRRPTLSPSVWRTKGCESHFWVRLGRIQWCE